MDDALRNSPVHQTMFLSAMSVAFQNPEARKAYEEDTGKAAYMPPSDPISKQIDESSGFARDSLIAFATWFAEKQWGKDEAPDIESLFVPAD